MKCSHKYFFNFDLSVSKDMFRSIAGIAFHRDGVGENRNDKIVQFSVST